MQWLTTSQAAKRLHIHPETLRKQLRGGQLDNVRIERTAGGHRRFWAQDIEAIASGELERTTPDKDSKTVQLDTAPTLEPFCEWPQVREPETIEQAPPVTIQAVPIKTLARSKGKSSWASSRDLQLLMGQTGPVVGITKSSEMLCVPQGNHSIIFGGARSGATAGLLTPTMLSHEGPAIAVALKDDLIRDSIAYRRTLGEVMVFDPAGALPLITGDLDHDRQARACVYESELASWSPLDGCRQWRHAQRISASIVNSGQGGSVTEQMAFFFTQAKALLGVLLHAADAMDEDIRRVIRWLARINDAQTHMEVDKILRWLGSVDALDAWIAFVDKDAMMRGDIAATTESLVVAYMDPRVQSSSMHRHNQVLLERLQRANTTLFIVAPMQDRDRFAPLLATLVESLLLQISDMPYNMPRPLQVLIDDTAFTAPMPSLADFLSTIGSKGVSITTKWQSLSQITDLYGVRRNTILNNARAKIVLPGICDLQTLDYFAKIGGALPARQQIFEAVASSQRDPSFEGMQFLVKEADVPLLSVQTLRNQPFGQAILVYGAMAPAKVQLPMFFLHDELRVRAGFAPGRKGLIRRNGWRWRA